ncbi:MAG: solute carrier family 23 protein, partial [Bacteroides sp.]
GLITQILVGHRLPVVIGPASVLLIGIISAGAENTSQIYTAIVVGGLFLFVLYVSKLLSKIQFIFTTRIIVVIMALIAFTLAPVILDLIFTGEEPLFALCFAIGMVLAMTLANRLLKGVWNAMVVILALVVGTAIHFSFYGVPAPIEVGKELSGLPFFNFPFEFNGGIILSFLFCYIALLVNELGSVQSVGQALKADRMNTRSERSVGITGILNMVSGSIGVVGPVDYSMSLGLINATGCASRYAILPAGVGLFICAFIPEALGLFNYIPPIVMGYILIYLMASQLSASFQMVADNDIIKNFNQGVIIGLPLMIALFVSFMPEEARNQLPALIRPILGNGFVMGVISVLILEHLVFREKEVKKA